MSSLVKSHNRSFLPRIEIRDKLQQESRETKEKTGFPLKNCGNDSNISNVALPLNYLVRGDAGGRGVILREKIKVISLRDLKTLFEVEVYHSFGLNPFVFLTSIS